MATVSGKVIPIKTGAVQVTAATVATVKTLINTAISGTFDYSKVPTVDYIRFSPEGTIRYSFDGTDPTASTGLIAVANGDYEIRGIPIDSIKFTSSSGNILVNVQVGTCA